MFLYIMHGLVELPPLLQYSHSSERPTLSGGWVFQYTVFLFSGSNSSSFDFAHHATGHLYIITDYDPCIEWKAAEYSNWWLWKWNKQQKNKNSNALQKTNSKQLYHFMPSKVGSSLCGQPVHGQCTEMQSPWTTLLSTDLICILSTPCTCMN